MSSWFVHYFQRCIPDQRFLWNVLALAGGTMIGQVLGVLVSPLLTRLYSPDDFGRFSLFSALIGFAAVGGALRYEAAIVSACDDEEASYLMLITLGLTLFTSLLAASVLYILIISSVLGFDDLPVWAALLAIPGSGLTTGFLILRYWLVRHGQFWIISRATVTQNAARAIIPTILGLLSIGWVGLAVGDIVGRGFGLRTMLWRSRIPLRTTLRALHATPIAPILHKYRSFPLYMLPSSVLNSMALLLPLPLIAHLYGIEAAGFFGLVQRLIAVPLSLVAASAADTFHNRVAEYQRDNALAMRGIFLRTTGGLLLLGIGPALLLMFLGPWLFSLVFGYQWIQAGVLAAVMAPMALAQLVVSPISRVVFVVGGQRAKLFYDLVALGAVVAGIYGGHALGLFLDQAVALWSSLSVVAYIIYFLILLRTVCNAVMLAKV